jgi:hypothetical protein
MAYKNCFLAKLPLLQNASVTTGSDISNGYLVTCFYSSPLVMWALAATAHVPTIATCKVRLLLLGHHSSDETAAASRLAIAVEGYGPLVHRRIIVVYYSTTFNWYLIRSRNFFWKN